MIRRGASAAFAAVLYLAFVTLGSGSAPAQTLAQVARATGTPGLLMSNEFRSESLDGLPQWTRVLDVTGPGNAFERCVADDRHCTSPTLKSWRTLIDSATGLSRREKIKVVNEFFNRWPYKRDPEVYGVSEYWATPNEFMARSGDCEDYSIAKYFALRQLGFAKEDLRVVILMDRIRAIGHAVLAVYHEGDILILDSLSNLITSHERYRHYVPQYSMNETTRWSHVRKAGVDEPKTFYQGLLARR